MVASCTIFNVVTLVTPYLGYDNVYSRDIKGIIMCMLTNATNWQHIHVNANILILDGHVTCYRYVYRCPAVSLFPHCVLLLNSCSPAIDFTAYNIIIHQMNKAYYSYLR